MDLAKKELTKKMVTRRAEKSILAGSIVHYEGFPSELIRVRPVDVWLPEGYDPASSDRYPVMNHFNGKWMR